jgi:tetratricopeptide (TPR) repeat protein
MNTAERIDLSLIGLATLLCLPGACGVDTGAPQAGESQPPTIDVVDASVEPWRRELLALGFEAASKLPLHPHIKNRARAQEQVVDACLELDLPVLALGCIERIPNWRRGAGYAEYALWCARNGATADQLEPVLDLALRIARDEAADDSSQAWRVDRIRARVAETRLTLGDVEQAATVLPTLEPSEVGRLQAALARRAETTDFEGEIDALEQTVRSGSLDQVRGGAVACAQLFDRFYSDAERRDRAEAAILACGETLPAPVQIEILLELARFSREHEDASKALELVERADGLREGARWTAEMEVPLLASLARARFEARDTERALAQAADALALYEAERETIIDVFRGEVLRPLAEAFFAMGDELSARQVYALAAEEGIHNPNSRPRAMDLTALCVSMARVGFEPDAALRERLVEIDAQLGDPW